MKQQTRKTLWRAAFYALGVLMMALGISMSTCTGLGVAPVNSVPFSIAKAIGIEFSTFVFAYYSFLMVLQFLIRGRIRWIDLLQLPFSIVFSTALGSFGQMLPAPDHFSGRIALLVVSIIVMAVGAAMTVDMHLVPNPPDGLVHALAWRFGRDLGFFKNIVDCTSVCVTCTVDLLFFRRITSVGVGTVVSMIFIGRVMYVFNRLCKKKIQRLAGVSEDIRK